MLWGIFFNTLQNSLDTPQKKVYYLKQTDLSVRLKKED